MHKFKGMLKYITMQKKIIKMHLQKNNLELSSGYNRNAFNLTRNQLVPTLPLNLLI